MKIPSALPYPGDAVLAKPAVAVRPVADAAAFAASLGRAPTAFAAPPISPKAIPEPAKARRLDPARPGQDPERDELRRARQVDLRV